MESLLFPLSGRLSNPVGRAKILRWVAENLRNCVQQTQRRSMHLTVLVVPTVQCYSIDLQERVKRFSNCFSKCFDPAGYKKFLSVGCRDIKPAKMRTIHHINLKLMESITEAQKSIMNQEEDVPTRPAFVSSNNESSISSENDSSMTSGIKSLRGVRQHGGRLGAPRAGRSLLRSLDVGYTTPKDSMENLDGAQGGRHAK
uniref:Uncharacterized protein AlNc14C237G9422 n=1 Tax=Albugo laibachii Nc14 TaxID=890382 RepID=F0WEZ8_9STRA|nr:conserved hypothetical protein [Albugo laibachii Nc14]CCA24404.1 conserved hypothetical protein [Albugo laibachii Nc14]|eukprot:CCA24404.1 conserved hypothetical protein [Albugo laibachii Nc14]